ncbi:MAG: endonuclease MutS2 [Anaeroplasmataceae bacterium]|nr:endonuclease MutS2 [Anaeroplasmataceae bacterium]
MHYDLEALEFKEVIAILKKYAKTNYGKERIEQLQPCNSYETVIRRNQETKEAYQSIIKLSDLPLGGLYEVHGPILRSKIGGILKSRELLDIVGLLDCGERVIKYFKSLESNRLETPTLSFYSTQICNYPKLRTNITLAIDTDGNITDNASKELFNIRRSIRLLENRLRTKLNELLVSKASMLTEHLIIMRNNRMCLPVKMEYKNTFKGIIHDVSSSNTTCYIEPDVTLEIANQMDSHRTMEQKEIENILKGLTLLVASEAEGLEKNLEALTSLDIIYAKALMGKELKYNEVHITENHCFSLIQAKHPLIPVEQVVPIDVSLTDPNQAIIITGPNTGGKTVALKTIGLLHAMMMCGMMLPCKETSSLSIFSEILVDIGDEQSIAQSLSTFSAHMKKMDSILHTVSFESLVLLDELGSGTDPKEGSSLAIAMIDYIKKRGAKLLVTTHYSDLKAYAYQEPGVLNASVEFNSQTLLPTYRLLIGVPGRSNAIEIARRLGLPEEVIEGSKNYMLSLDHANHSQLLNTVEDKIHELRKQDEELKHKIEVYDSLTQKLTSEKMKLTQQSDKILEAARMEAKQIIEKTMEEAKQILQELKEKENTEYKDHELANLKHRVRKLAQQEEDKALFEEDLAIGDYVFIKSYEQYGTILKIKKDKYTVQMGQFSMDFDKSSLVKASKPVEKKQKQTRLSGYNPASHASLSLDLRGKRYEEVKDLMDSYIDQAILGNLEMISIIHGFGTGAIRKAVWEYLKSCPYAKSYRYGQEGEGLNGVTIVKLR